MGSLSKVNSFINTGNSVPVVSPSGGTDTSASTAYMLSLGITPVTPTSTQATTTASTSGGGNFIKSLTGLNTTTKADKSGSVTGSSNGTSVQNISAEQILHNAIYPDEVVDPTTGLTKKAVQDAYNNAKLGTFLKSGKSNGFTLGGTPTSEKTVNRVYNQLTSSEYNSSYQSGYNKGYADYYNEGYQLGRETKQQVTSAGRDWGYGFIKFADSVVDTFQDWGAGDSGIDSLDILTGRLVGETTGTSVAQQKDAALASWAFGANVWNQVVYSMTQNIADTALTMVTMGTAGAAKAGFGGAIEGVKAATGNSLVKSLTGSATNLSLAIMAMRVVGDEYQNNIISSPYASTKEALGKALISAAIEIGTEKMSGIGNIGALGAAQNSSGIIDAIWDVIGDCFGEGTIMSSIVSGFLGESFEEIVSQYAGDLVNQAYYRAGSELGSDTWSSMEDYFLAGLTGGISGALGAGSKHLFASGVNAGRDAFSTIRNTIDTSPSPIEAALGATESPVKANIANNVAQQQVMAQREAEYQERSRIATEEFIKGAQQSMQHAAQLHNAGITYREYLDQLNAIYNSVTPEEAKSIFQQMEAQQMKIKQNDEALDKARKENIASVKNFMSDSEANLEYLRELGEKFGSKNVKAVISGKSSTIDAETALAIQYALAGEERASSGYEDLKRGTREQRQKLKQEQQKKDEEVKKKAEEKASRIVTRGSVNGSTTGVVQHVTGDGSPVNKEQPMSEHMYAIMQDQNAGRGAPSAKMRGIMEQGDPRATKPKSEGKAPDLTKVRTKALLQQKQSLEKLGDSINESNKATLDAINKELESRKDVEFYQKEIAEEEKSKKQPATYAEKIASMPDRKVYNAYLEAMNNQSAFKAELPVLRAELEKRGINPKKGTTSKNESTPTTPTAPTAPTTAPSPTLPVGNAPTANNAPTATTEKTQSDVEYENAKKKETDGKPYSDSYLKRIVREGKGTRNLSVDTAKRLLEERKNPETPLSVEPKTDEGTPVPSETNVPPIEEAIKKAKELAPEAGVIASPETQAAFHDAEQTARTILIEQQAEKDALNTAAAELLSTGTVEATSTTELNKESVFEQFKDAILKENGITEFSEEEKSLIMDLLTSVGEGYYNLKVYEDTEDIRRHCDDANLNSPSILEMLKFYSEQTSPFAEMTNTAQSDYTMSSEFEEYRKYVEGNNGKPSKPFRKWYDEDYLPKKNSQNIINKAVTETGGNMTPEQKTSVVKGATKALLKEKEVKPEEIKKQCKNQFTKMLVDIAVKKGYTFYDVTAKEFATAALASGELSARDAEMVRKRYLEGNGISYGITFRQGKCINIDLLQIHNEADTYGQALKWRENFASTQESFDAFVENCIAHECIHAMFEFSTINNSAVAEVQQATTALNQLFDTAKRLWIKQNGDTKGVYAFKDTSEFLSELANPMLRQWLAQNVGFKTKFMDSVVNFLHKFNIAMNVQTAQSYLANLYSVADVYARNFDANEIKSIGYDIPFFFTSSQFYGWNELGISKQVDQAIKEEKSKTPEAPKSTYQSETHRNEVRKIQQKAATQVFSQSVNGKFSNLTSPFASVKTTGKTQALQNSETGRKIFYETAKTKDGNDIRYYVFETRIDETGKDADLCIAKINPGKDAYGTAVKIMNGFNNFHYVCNIEINPFAIPELTPTTVSPNNKRGVTTSPELGSSKVASIAAEIQRTSKKLLDESTDKPVDMTAIVNKAMDMVKAIDKDGYDLYMKYMSAGIIDLDTLHAMNPDAFTIDFSTDYDNGDTATINRVWDEIEGDVKTANRTPVNVHFKNTTDLKNQAVFEASVGAFVDRFIQHGLSIEGHQYSFETATANDLKHNKLRALDAELIGNGLIPNLRKTVEDLGEKVKEHTATAEEYALWKQAKTQLELNAGLEWEQIEKTGSKTLTNKGVGQTGSDSYADIKAYEEKRAQDIKTHRAKGSFRVFKGEGKIGECIVVRDIYQQFAQQLMNVEGDSVGKLALKEDGTPNISGDWKEAQDGMGLTDGSTFQMRADAMGHKGVLCKAEGWQQSIQSHGKEVLDKLNATTLLTDQYGRIYTDLDIPKLQELGIKYYPMMGYNQEHSEVGLYDRWGTWQSLNVNSYGMEVHHLLTDSMVKFAGSYKGTEDYYKWCGDKDIRVIPKENIYGSGFEDTIDTEGLTEEQLNLKSYRKLAIRQMMRGMDVTDEQLEKAMYKTEEFCRDILGSVESQRSLVKGQNKTLDRLLEEYPNFIGSSICKTMIDKKLNRIRNLASYSTILTAQEQRQYSWILADPINIISYLSGDVTAIGFYEDSTRDESVRKDLGQISEMPDKYQGTSIPLGSLSGSIKDRMLSEKEATETRLDPNKVVAPNMPNGESVITRSPMTSMHDARPVLNDISSVRKATSDYGVKIDRDILYIQLNSSLMQRLDNDFDGDTSTMMQDAAIVEIIKENLKNSRILGTDNVTSFPHGKGKSMKTTIETISYALKACLHNAGVGLYDTYLDRIYASNYLSYEMQEEYAAVAAAGYILATDYTKTGYMPETFLKYVNTMAAILNGKVSKWEGKTYVIAGEELAWRIGENNEWTPVEMSEAAPAFADSKKNYEVVAPHPEYYHYGSSGKQSTWLRNHGESKSSEKRKKALTNPERREGNIKRTEDAENYGAEGYGTKIGPILNTTNKFSNKAHEYSIGIGEYGKTVEKNKFAWKKGEGNWFSQNANYQTEKLTKEERDGVKNSLLIGGQTIADIQKGLKAINPVKQKITQRLKAYDREATDYSGINKARREFAVKNGISYGNNQFWYKGGEKYYGMPTRLEAPRKLSRMSEEFWTDYLKPCYDEIKNIVNDDITAVNVLTSYIYDIAGTGPQTIMYSYMADYIDECRVYGVQRTLDEFMTDTFTDNDKPDFAKDSKYEVQSPFCYLESEKGEVIFDEMASDFEESFWQTAGIDPEGTRYYDSDGNEVEDTESWLNSFGSTNIPDSFAPPVKENNFENEPNPFFSDIGSNPFFSGAEVMTEAQLEKEANKMNEERKKESKKETTVEGNHYDGRVDKWVDSVKAFGYPKCWTKAEKVAFEKDLKEYYDTKTEDNFDPNAEVTFEDAKEQEIHARSNIKASMKKSFVEHIKSKLDGFKVASNSNSEEDGMYSQRNFETLRAYLYSMFEGGSPDKLVQAIRNISEAGEDNYLNNVREIRNAIIHLNEYYDKVNDVTHDKGDMDRYVYAVEQTAQLLEAHYRKGNEAQAIVKQAQGELTKNMKNKSFRKLFTGGNGFLGDKAAKHIVKQLSPGSLLRVLGGENKDSALYKLGVKMEKSEIKKGLLLGYYQTALTDTMTSLGYTATKDKTRFIKEMKENLESSTDFYGLTKGEVLNLYMTIKDTAGWYHLNHTGFENGEGKIVKCNGKKGNPTIEEVKTKVYSIVAKDAMLTKLSKNMRSCLNSYSTHVGQYRQEYLGYPEYKAYIRGDYWMQRTGLSNQGETLNGEDDNVRLLDDFISMNSRMFDPEGCVMKCNALELFTQYCNSMAKTCAHASIQKDLFFMSQKTHDNKEDYSLREFLTKNNFDTVEEYIQDLSNDLSGKKTKDGFNELLGNFANSVLTGSVQTAVRQKASFWNALAQIPSKYLNKYWGIVSLDSTQFTNDERIQALAKYSGIIEMRRADVDKVTSARENIKRNFGEEINLSEFSEMVAEKTPEFMKGMIPGVDVQTTCRITFACWDYVKDQKAKWQNMTNAQLAQDDEFMRAFADKTETVISQTQPMYGLLFRSQVQRSTGIERSMLMFRTQQGRNFNQLVEGYFNKEFNGDDTQLKMASYGLGLSAVSYAALGLLGTVIKGKADKWDEDDDGTIDVSAVLKQLITGTASAVYSTDWLGTYLGGIAVSMITGDRYYGFEANGVAQLNDLATNLINTSHYIGKGKYGKAAESAWNTVLSATQVAGIPLENAINTMLAPIRVTMTAAQLVGFNAEIEKEAASRGIDYTSPKASTVDSNDIVLSAVAKYNSNVAYEEQAVALLKQYGITEKTEGYSTIKSTVISELKKADSTVEKTYAQPTTSNAMVNEAIKEANLSSYYTVNADQILEQQGITKDNTENYSSIRSELITTLKNMDKPAKTAPLPTGNSMIDSAIEDVTTSQNYSDNADAILAAYGMTKDNTENYSQLHTKIVASLKQIDEDQAEYENSGLTDTFANREEYTAFKESVDTNSDKYVSQTELQDSVYSGAVDKSVANAYWDAMVAAHKWSSTTKKKF